MKICVAGEGAFGNKHLDAIARITDIEVVALAGGVAEDTASLARNRGIPFWMLDLEEAMAQPGVEAVILATATPMHAPQAAQVLRAGKHVLVEIPMADSLAASKNLVKLQKVSNRIGMVGHTRRVNPCHQWIYQQINKGLLTLQQMDVQTYFFRRSNINALGQKRSWTDHLLWHHACHTVDLFQYHTGELSVNAFALQGPIDADLGVAMDMSIGLQVPSGAICTVSLSFNNQGPLGSFIRYICDNGTYTARYDDLFDGHNNKIDVSKIADTTDGIELCDREFFSAIKENREPLASFEQCLQTMQTLHNLEQWLD
jgi:2-hydroxy-4-carboxymuconate semialdehyde hemiacetal dehydrogenase